MTKSSMLINEHTCPQNPESVKYSALKSACCTNAGASLTAQPRSCAVNAQTWLNCNGNDYKNKKWRTST